MHSNDDSGFLDDLHKGIDVGLHADILFGNLRTGNLSFPDLFQECIKITRTTVRPWKIFRRVQRAFVLSRYIEYTAAMNEPRIECGVYKGLSALLSCKVLKNINPLFDGSNFYLCDSYEGLSPLRGPDLLQATVSDGITETFATHGTGHFAASLSVVRGYFADFPRINFVKGWIPPVLSTLPDTTWSFVHIDVDLYEPTMACLDYFLPRMANGGVILNDDFASPSFPGGGKAWKEFFHDRGLSYAVLDTGQAIFINS